MKLKNLEYLKAGLYSPRRLNSEGGRHSQTRGNEGKPCESSRVDICLFLYGFLGRRSSNVDRNSASLYENEAGAGMVELGAGGSWRHLSCRWGPAFLSVPFLPVFGTVGGKGVGCVCA